MTQLHTEDERQAYQITVRGELDDRWSDWFSGLDISRALEQEGAPVTILTGTIDQATLRGIADKIWDLNLTLVSITTVDTHV